jgi:hypothetical protein
MAIKSAAIKITAITKLSYRKGNATFCAYHFKEDFLESLFGGYEATIGGGFWVRG